LKSGTCLCDDGGEVVDGDVLRAKIDRARNALSHVTRTHMMRYDIKTCKETGHNSVRTASDASSSDADVVDLICVRDRMHT
jgi:hypothetical protein